MNSAVIVVTGAGSGLGRAICEKWREENPEGVVILLDIDVNAIQKTAHSIGGKTAGFIVDVRDSARVNQVFSEIKQRWDHIDGLVNCAGNSRPSASESISDEEWNSVIDIHLSGTLRVCRAAFPLMQGNSAIVNLGSVASVVGMPQRASYNSAKHAIVGLTKSLAVEWASNGIRVNAVAPGYVLTDLTKKLIAEQRLNPDKITARTPLGRWAEPVEIADGILFLLSEKASFITGHTLMIDGGMTIAGDWYE